MIQKLRSIHWTACGCSRQWSADGSGRHRTKWEQSDIIDAEHEGPVPNQPLQPR